MTEATLREKANIARKVAITLAENIYRYLGDVISKKDLKNVVDQCINKNKIEQFTHMYILKDTYEDLSLTGFMNDLEANIEEE